MTHEADPVLFRLFFGYARDDVFGLDVDFFPARLVGEIDIVAGQDCSHPFVSTCSKKPF
jgi:hypothetical protein